MGNMIQMDANPAHFTVSPYLMREPMPLSTEQRLKIAAYRTQHMLGVAGAINAERGGVS